MKTLPIPSTKEILDLNREWDDEHKRVFGRDFSPKVYSSRPFVSMRYVPDTDALSHIEEFESKPLGIMPMVMEHEPPLHMFGVNMPLCTCVHLVHVCEGCVSVVPVFSGNETDTIEMLETIADKFSRRSRKGLFDERGKVKFHRISSPHLTGRGWNPSLAVAQKHFGLGSLSDGSFTVKVEERGWEVITCDSRED